MSMANFENPRSLTDIPQITSGFSRNLRCLCSPGKPESFRRVNP